MRYVFVYRNRYEFPVRLSCHVLEVSASGYYGFLRRRENNIQQADLIALIREVHRRSRYTYGSRRIMRQLRRNGLIIGRWRVRRLMRFAGIHVKRKRKYRTTTKSNHRYPVSPNLIQGCFRVAKPNLVWVSDITYIKTMEGWLYLAVIMDLFSRKVVGWSLARNMAVKMVKEALYMAIGRRKPDPGLIHHSDRGIQYACNEYRQLLQNYGLKSSMSRSGNCLDNAVAERFFRTLKSECLMNWRDMPAKEVKHDIVDYIEMFYNSERLHSYAGYLSPNDYEKMALTLV
ncbi:MAG: IS3 family transposase [Dehalococcoidales bacterium]|nr:IS3 family transposase [Dehalococcoidales bacterium]